MEIEIVVPPEESDWQRRGKPVAAAADITSGLHQLPQPPAVSCCGLTLPHKANWGENVWYPRGFEDEQSHPLWEP